jgi:hypothetical protein
LKGLNSEENLDGETQELDLFGLISAPRKNSPQATIFIDLVHRVGSDESGSDS